MVSKDSTLDRFTLLSKKKERENNSREGICNYLCAACPKEKIFISNSAEVLLALFIMDSRDEILKYDEFNVKLNIMIEK